MHTIPLGALIWYNNTTDIVYDEDLDLMAKIVFMMSLVFNLGEIVTFYFFKVTGDNIELTKELPRRPRTSNYFVRIIGFCSIMLAGVAITIGTQAFSEKKCLDQWFIDEDVLCKDCTVYFG